MIDTAFMVPVVTGSLEGIRKVRQRYIDLGIEDSYMLADLDKIELDYIDFINDHKGN